MQIYDLFGEWKDGSFGFAGIILGKPFLAFFS